MITLAETILLNAYALKRVLVLTGFMELGDYSKDVNASDGLDYTVDVKHHVLHEVAFALDVNQSMRNSGLVPGVDVIKLLLHRANVFLFRFCFLRPGSMAAG